jgi:tetratricopeptide (TPR) repeat protein
MKSTKRLLSSLSVVACVLATNVALVEPVYAETKASEKKTRKVPTLRGKVYEQLSRAQTFADQDQSDEAFAVLAEVEDKKSSMNSYEIAMLYNFYGFIYYNLEQPDKALEYFNKVVEQQPIPKSFEQSTVFTIAQLSLMQGDYKAAIANLERWEDLNVGPTPPKNLFIKAQAYYQDKQYEQAATFIDQAVSDKEAAGMIPDEGWLILQRAIYYELKDTRKVKDIIVKMVKLFNEPKYWIQLGGMYGELEMEKHQLAIMEAAYQQGYLVKGADLFNMAQLYYYHKAPIKCANVMQAAMDDGLLEENLRNLKFLGQCLQLAKENEKAVPVMRAAAELAPDGELYAQLAQLFLNIDKFDDAIANAELALEKGDLRNQGTVHLVLGMSYYNQRQFVKALDQLAKAEAFKNTRKMAEQWQQFVSGEKRTFEALQAEIASE